MSLDGVGWCVSTQRDLTGGCKALWGYRDAFCDKIRRQVVQDKPARACKPSSMYAGGAAANRAVDTENQKSGLREQSQGDQTWLLKLEKL